VAASIALLFIPESPKYLVAIKKYDDARKVLLQMARINKVEVNVTEMVFEQEL
jgi:Sugar (and other) transporter